jgi:hypothetical protein
MIAPHAPINAGWERYRDTVLMPMDADAIETARLAWFCAAVFLWELTAHSTNYPGLATTIGDELRAFKDSWCRTLDRRRRRRLRANVLFFAPLVEGALATL